MAGGITIYGESFTVLTVSVILLRGVIKVFTDAAGIFAVILTVTVVGRKQFKKSEKKLKDVIKKMTDGDLDLPESIVMLFCPEHGKMRTAEPDNAMVNTGGYTCPKCGERLKPKARYELTEDDSGGDSSSTSESDDQIESDDSHDNPARLHKTGGGEPPKHLPTVAYLREWLDSKSGNPMHYSVSRREPEEEHEHLRVRELVRRSDLEELIKELRLRWPDDKAIRQLSKRVEKKNDES